MLYPPPEFRQLGDAPADALVRSLFDRYGDKKARQIYLQLVHTFDLIDTAQLPEEIRDFHAGACSRLRIEHPEKIALASAYFQRSGHAMFLVLIAKCLPQVYTSYRGSKVLYETGYLVGKDNKALVARRLMETAQFYIDVLHAGSLRPDGYGAFAATKVRLIHAFVRRFLWDKGWNEKFAAEYDQPVCQEDMTGTLLAFSACMIEGLHQLGIAISDDEADAVMYTWHIAGQLLGVDDRFNPTDYAGGSELFHHLLNKEKKAGMENQALAQAILTFMRDIFTPKAVLNSPWGFQNKFPELLVSYFVGPEYAPYIGLNYHTHPYYKNLVNLVGLVLPNIFIQSRRIPLTDEAILRTSGYLVAMILRYIKEHYHLEFRLPDDILRDWKLTPYLPGYGAIYARSA